MGTGLQSKKSRSRGTYSGSDPNTGAWTTTGQGDSEGSGCDIAAQIPWRTRVLTSGGTTANTQNASGAYPTCNAEEQRQPVSAMVVVADKG